MAIHRTQVRYLFGDREGNTATLTAWVSPSLSPSELTAFINQFADLVQPLTSGIILQVDVYTRAKIDNPEPATVDADINALVALFYRNEQIYEAIWIPAPKAELFESTGAYAGIRVDATAPELAPFIDIPSSFISQLSTPENDPFPEIYTVGGLAL